MVSLHQCMYSGCLSATCVCVYVYNVCQCLWVCVSTSASAVYVMFWYRLLYLSYMYGTIHCHSTLTLTFGKIWQLHYSQYITHALYIRTTCTEHVSTVFVYCQPLAFCTSHGCCASESDRCTAPYIQCVTIHVMTVSTAAALLLGTYMMYTTCRPPPGLCWQVL